MGNNKKITLHFFNVGISQAARHACIIGDIVYTEDKIPEKEYRERYPNAPLGIALSIEGEPDVVSAQGVLRYLGSMSGMYSPDPFKAMQIDEILCLCATYRSKLNSRLCTLEECFELFESVVRGKFMTGTEGTIADLEFYTFVNWCMSRDTDTQSVLENCPKIKQIIQLIKNHPKLIEAETRRRQLEKSRSRK